MRKPVRTLFCRQPLILLIVGITWLLSISCLGTPSLGVEEYFVGHVASRWHVPGGYFTLRGVNYSESFAPEENSCFEHARQISEPYTSTYWKRASLQQLMDEQPVSLWQWEGKVSEDLFWDYIRRDHIVKQAHYKIVGGHVYVNMSSVEPRHLVRKERVDEMLRVTAYLYPLPDMDFLVHFHDGCQPGKPIFTFAGCRQHPNVGFTMPSYSVWTHALGPTQMTAYHSCLRTRYPAKDRIPKIVWRGSSTGHVVGPNMEVCMQLLRVRVHMLAREHPDILDTHLTSLVQMCAEILKPVINDTVSGFPGEGVNKYCAILDVDGNSWSDRFAGSIVHFPTPILKQASNFTGYIEHVFPPSIAIEEFDPSLVGLVETAKQMIDDCKKGEKSKGQALSRRSMAIARKYLSHVGVASSMAYGLVQFKKASSWETSTSLEGWTKLDKPCCKFVNLPPEMVADMNRLLAERR